MPRKFFSVVVGIVAVVAGVYGVLSYYKNQSGTALAGSNNKNVVQGPITVHDNAGNTSIITGDVNVGADANESIKALADKNPEFRQQLRQNDYIQADRRLMEAFRQEWGAYNAGCTDLNRTESAKSCKDYADHMVQYYTDRVKLYQEQSGVMEATDRRSQCLYIRGFAQQAADVGVKMPILPNC